MKRVEIAVCLALFAGLFLSGCRDFKTESCWKDREISVDGNDDEWRGRMVKAMNVYFGAMNDAENLYVCMSVTDKKTKAQMMGLFKQTFTLWFDPNGKKAKAFGLRFSNDSAFMNEVLVEKIRYLRTPLFQVIGSEMMNNLQVEILEHDYPVAMLSDAKGIDIGAGISMSGRKLTYEFKIPLGKSADAPFAIGARECSEISMGVETSEIDMNMIIEQQRKNIEAMQQGKGPAQSAPQGRPAGGRGGGYSDSPFLDPELEAFKTVGLWGTIKLGNASESAPYEDAK
ncbi:MAG: hypothetical protein JW803_00805 [Endomicrobiales bacterium]|nr:hypothetical protein [Endomicrobiales bacterium]